MNGCWKWNKQNAGRCRGGSISRTELDRRVAQPAWPGVLGVYSDAQDHPRQPSATAPDLEPTTSLIASTYVQLISSAEGHGRLVL